MKKGILLILLMTMGMIPGCQCSDPPPVGPVEPSSESSMHPSRG